MSVIEERHVRRFRDIVWFDPETRHGRTVGLRAEVSGDMSIIDTCEVVHYPSGSVLASGDGSDACDEALDEFEDLVKG